MSAVAVSCPDIRTIVAGNIQRFIAEKKKTRQEVADDLDIKYTTLCDWINAKSSPKLETLETLGRYFGVAIGDFFIDFDNIGDSVSRISAYAREAVNLDMSVLDSLTDEQIRELLNRGFSFKHKTIKDYVKESGGVLKVSPEFDWGEPVGDEIW